MQQPISEANLEVIFRDFVSQNLVNWFLNPVSKMDCLASVKSIHCLFEVQLGLL